MATVLTVTNPFSGYERGQRITDASEVSAVLASEFAANVVQASAADAPAGKPLVPMAADPPAALPKTPAPADKA